MECGKRSKSSFHGKGDKIMLMELIKVNDNFLKENINNIKANTDGKVYLFMNNQTMRCLESIDASNFETHLEYSSGEEEFRHHYNGNKIILDNDIEFGKVEIR